MHACLTAQPASTLHRASPPETFGGSRPPGRLCSRRNGNHHSTPCSLSSLIPERPGTMSEQARSTISRLSSPLKKLLLLRAGLLPALRRRGSSTNRLDLPSLPLLGARQHAAPSRRSPFFNGLLDANRSKEFSFVSVAEFRRHCRSRRQAVCNKSVKPVWKQSGPGSFCPVFFRPAAVRKQSRVAAVPVNPVPQHREGRMPS